MNSSTLTLDDYTAEELAACSRCGDAIIDPDRTINALNRPIHKSCLTPSELHLPGFRFALAGSHPTDHCRVCEKPLRGWNVADRHPGVHSECLRDCQGPRFAYTTGSVSYVCTRRNGAVQTSLEPIIHRHTAFCISTILAERERIFNLPSRAARIEAFRIAPKCACKLEPKHLPMRPVSAKGLLLLQAKAERQKVRELARATREKAVAKADQAKTKEREERMKAWRSLYPGMPKAKFSTRWRPTAQEQARLQAVLPPKQAES